MLCRPAQQQDPGPCHTLVSESFGRWVKGDKARLWRGGWCLIGGFQSLLCLGWFAACLGTSGAAADRCLCLRRWWTVLQHCRAVPPACTGDPVLEPCQRHGLIFQVGNDPVWGLAGGNGPGELPLNSSGGRQRKEGSGCGAAWTDPPPPPPGVTGGASSGAMQSPARGPGMG